MKLALIDTNNAGIKAIFRFTTDEGTALNRLGVIYDDTKQWLFRADPKPWPMTEDELQQLTNEVRLLNNKHYPKPLPPEMLQDRGFNPDYSVH